MSERVSALLAAELFHELEPLGLTARNIRTLLRNPDFQVIPDRTHFIREQCCITIKDKEISTVYDISVSNVRKSHYLATKHSQSADSNV
jgi:hypothetical protein